jgi:predicted acyl esterase
MVQNCSRRSMFLTMPNRIEVIRFSYCELPYSVGPYGIDLYKGTLGPSVEFEKSGYIFAFQDVRGRYMSEGEFVNMRPHIESKRERNSTRVATPLIRSNG